MRHSYLDMFNYHYAIFDTPSVQEDEAAWRSQLVHVVCALLMMMMPTYPSPFPLRCCTS